MRYDMAGRVSTPRDQTIRNVQPIVSMVIVSSAFYSSFVAHLRWTGRRVVRRNSNRTTI